MLYTKKGDSGVSGLYGTDERFPKDQSVFDALGAVDELNSLLGLCRSKADSLFPELATDIKLVQETLFIVQAELAGAPKSVTTEHTQTLERSIDCLERSLHNPHAFIIPGSTEYSALFDYARAVSRRTERDVIKLHTKQPIAAPLRAYLNRLSSFLYALARYAAVQGQATEHAPTYKPSCT